MKIKKKRGVSALIATVLLILITVAAASIIWAVVMPMMQQAMQLKQACMGAILRIDPENTCTAIDTLKVLKVAVERGSEEFVIEEIAFSIAGDGIAKSVFSSTAGEVLEPTTPEKLKDILGPLEKYTFEINLTAIGMVPGPGGNVDKLSSVSVAPRVRVGRAVRTCDVTDTLTTVLPCK